MFLFTASSSSLLPLSGSSWMMENLQGVPVFFMLPLFAISRCVDVTCCNAVGATPSSCSADVLGSLVVCWARRRLKSCKFEKRHDMDKKSWQDSFLKQRQPEGKWAWPEGTGVAQQPCLLHKTNCFASTRFPYIFNLVEITRCGQICI